MANAIESYATLNLNPFLLSPLLVSFYGALDDKENSFLLSYLILPLVLPPASRKFLENSNKTSSLRTLVKNREPLIGVQARIEGYRQLTNECIQFALDLGCIEVNEQLAIRMLSPMNTAACPGHTVKATKNLARIFRPYSVLEIYRLLGIKQI